MNQQVDRTAVEDWNLLYDPSDRVHRVIAQLVGFDPENPTRDSLYAFMDARLRLIDAIQEAGPDGIELLHTRVPDAEAKVEAIRCHLQSGRSWPSVERRLGIPWNEQVRLATNGHATRLWTWTLEERIDFEEMCRIGASVNSLARTFRLPYHQTETLVSWFRK